jgi:hypothetical protein
VRDNGQIRNLAAYVILAVSLRRNWGRVLGELEIMHPDRLTVEET